MADWSDEEIVVGLARADQRQAALQQLGKRWLGPLRSYLWKQCQDYELADELAVQVLLKAYEVWSKESDTPCRSLRSWLFKVAKNKLIDAKRAEDADFSDMLSLDAPGSVDREHHSLWSSSDPCVSQIDLAIAGVMAELAKEDSKAHSLLEMKHIAQCSSDEISAATGIKVKDLNQYTRRAQQKFVRIARRYPVLARFTSD